MGVVESATHTHRREEGSGCMRITVWGGDLTKSVFHYTG